MVQIHPRHFRDYPLVGIPATLPTWWKCHVPRIPSMERPRCSIVYGSSLSSQEEGLDGACSHINNLNICWMSHLKLFKCDEWYIHVIKLDASGYSAAAAAWVQEYFNCIATMNIQAPLISVINKPTHLHVQTDAPGITMNSIDDDWGPLSPLTPLSSPMSLDTTDGDKIGDGHEHFPQAEGQFHHDLLQL